MGLSSPGPEAHRAFRSGMLFAAVAGLAALGGLYWVGLLEPLHIVFAIAVCGPVYLIIAASALSIWLGFDKDASDLRRVTREKEDRTETGPGRRPQS